MGGCAVNLHVFFFGIVVSSDGIIYFGIISFLYLFLYKMKIQLLFVSDAHLRCFQSVLEFYRISNKYMDIWSHICRSYFLFFQITLNNNMKN